jgi:5-methylcytosine-specific restriction enzyme subunit McrC
MDEGTGSGVRFRECWEYSHVRVQRDEILKPDGSLDISPAVQNLNAFTIDFKGNELRLMAGGFVGILPINNRLVLRITPRTPIANLTRMVERSGYQALPIDALRTYAASTSISEWLLDIYADALIRHCAEIVNGGLYRTYQRRNDAGSRPRGHIEVSATLRRFAARGVRNKAEFSWFERTTDNALNQCLKAALFVLHRRYVGPRKGLSKSRVRVRQLSSLLQSFADVSDDERRRYLSDPIVAGLASPPVSRSYYREPLRLAIAIIANRGVSLDEGSGNVTLSSLLLNMGELFEAYVRTTLQSKAADAAWPISVLDGNNDGNLPLYTSPSPRTQVGGTSLTPLIEAVANPPRVTPDIVFRRADGSIALVAELKNTLMKDLPSRSEVEQAVTYAVRYGTSTVLLVHPKGETNRGGLQLLGQVGTVMVFDYRYDLAAADLDAEDDLFASKVAALLGLAT